ncbi:uncharacterized protein J4E84_005021 [Alternaria hordeiaustralica]|uniref:uncharacterized protein n=1 Tax=Alternaria hordeiaustralica TaxID=1187925 RepID=UPI0020C430FB|nr:uncharacterized protein J4E84_005021 [Alternaria hordeiaustralica]KAI4688093.1 hypothetical protein J4E84_005021 [Alternaria hordeiaustralica]
MLNDLYRPGVVSEPWGPLISPDYTEDEFTNLDVLVASIPWALTLANVILALWQIYHQTKLAKTPIRSPYLWMAWLELGACFALGLVGYLHVLKHIPASFAFYFGILACWSFQVMLLFQIIVNRIRVIDVNRKHGDNIFIAVTVYITVVIISGFIIWIPARMQISHYWEFISAAWDRTEKCLFLIIDLALNWYFLRMVKNNLIRNGLTKYNKIVQFNQRIIVLSILMDIMLIAATAIPKAFVYVQFHSLCYLVKLNIEMAMANLIRRIAISNFTRTGAVHEFKDPSTYASESYHNTFVSNRGSVQLGSVGNIKATTHYTVTSEANPFPNRGRQPSRVEVDISKGNTDSYSGTNRPVIVIEEPETKSLDGATEVAESYHTDDEAVLVEKRGHW